MNWISFIAAIPYVLAGIQQIHGSQMAGADKKTLALQSLGLAESIAGGVLTGNNLQYASVAGSLIDNFVTTFKANHLFGFTPNVVPVAPVTGAVASTSGK